MTDEEKMETGPWEFAESEYVMRQVSEPNGVSRMETRRLVDGSYVVQRHRLDDPRRVSAEAIIEEES